MPFRILPAGFSWLLPSCRPTPQEVDAYARAIAHAEGHPPEVNEARLHAEAELQLWIWRTENRRARRRSRPRADLTDSANFAR